MRILHTVPRYAPETGGSEEVVRQLSEKLVSFGHEVIVATGRSAARTFSQLGGVTIVEFDCSGNMVEGFRGDHAGYVRFIREIRADVMMNYHGHIWTTDLLLDHLDALAMGRVFVPVGFYQLRNPRYAEYFTKMPRYLASYDRVVYLSAQSADKAFADRRGLRNGVVIPNGADLGEFRQSSDGRFRSRYGLGSDTLILNVSNHSLLKNHAFFWRTLRMLGRKDVAAVLIGNPFHRSPKKWLSQCYPVCRANGVRQGIPVLEGLPRETVIDAYHDADIFLFGSQVECSPLVMFESFASRTLFVSTDCGNVGEYDGIACIVKDERDAVRVINDVLAHPAKYEDRVRRGYDLVWNRLNWDAIARAYEALYKDVIEGEGRP